MKKSSYTIDSNKIEIRKDINTGCLAHYHNMVELIYYLNGTHLAIINEKQKLMTENDITITNQYDVHHYTSNNRGELILLQLNDFFMSQFTNLFPNKYFHNYLCNKEKNKLILNELICLLKSPNDKLLQASIVNKILYLIVSEYSLRETDTQRQTLTNILIYISKNYMNEITRDKIANQFGYTPSYFSTFFKKNTGIAFNEYLNMYRYNMVNEQLEHANLKNKTTIILSNGFSSTLNYYRYKKKFNQMNYSFTEKINEPSIKNT